MKRLTRDLILEAFTRLGQLAVESGITLEVCIYGGAAMLLAYNSRHITKDVDAIFVQSSGTGNKLALQVALELGLPQDWLNDNVKCYIAPEESTRELPWVAPGIKLRAPTASYLLALKALACRRPLPGFEGDIADLRFLIRKLNISSILEIQEHIDRYYPHDTIADGDAELLQSLIDEAKNED